MKKIDKYIFMKYITTFLFVVLILTMIASIIDFSEKVENFIEEDCTINEIIFDYYFGFWPYINSLLLPLYALISVIFFTSRLAFNSEIISILNAGVSFYRLLMPYLAAACLIAAVHLIGNHFIVPQGNKSRLDFEHKYVWKNNDKGKTKNVHMFLNERQKVYIRYYSKKDSTAHDFTIERFDENLHLESYLHADKARWVDSTKKWRLKNYERRFFSGNREKFSVNKKGSIDTLLNLVPEDFVRFLNQKEMLASPELKRFIKAEQHRGVSNTRIYEIELYRRTSEPITIIILTIIGVAIAARKVRGGIGLHLAIGIGLGAIFIFLSKFSVTFAASNNIPSLLGVWIPNIVFSMVAVYLVSKAQK